MNIITISHFYENSETAISGLAETLKEIKQEIIHVSHSITFSGEDNGGLGGWALTAIVIVK